MPAKKKAGNGKAKKKAAGRNRFLPDQKIALLVKQNPKRKTSDAFKRFAKYRDGMTVKTALARGVTRFDLRAPAAGLRSRRPRRGAVPHHRRGRSAEHGGDRPASRGGRAPAREACGHVVDSPPPPTSSGVGDGADRTRAPASCW